MTDAERIVDLERRLALAEDRLDRQHDMIMAYVEWLNRRIYKLEGVEPREHYLCNLRVVEGKQLRLEATT